MEASGSMRLLWAGTLRDRLRLWSGLVLFTFALTHFLNHALGLWSLEAMAAFQHARLVVTRSPPGSAILVLALFTHGALALVKLARVRNLRFSRAEIMQGLSGFLIPLFLASHLFEAGVEPRAAGTSASYPAILSLLWPNGMAWQILLLLVVWLHGCLGLHYWLRGEGWYARASHLLAGVAALVPAAAIAGAVTAGREVARLADATQIHAAVNATPGLTPAARAAAGAGAHVAILAIYGAAAMMLAALAMRRTTLRRLSEVSIAYVGGPTVRAFGGLTLLEISQLRGVPHLSVCGGKARCSTCRVRIVSGASSLAAPNEAERRLLGRIGAQSDIRLACQIRPTAALTVAHVLKPHAPLRRGRIEEAGVDGIVAVLFVDIRGFTRLSEAKLAYDVVFILNSFFTAAGQAIEAAGGRVDKYIGDGLMAVFEHPGGLTGAARAALDAIGAIDAELARVNQRLANEIAEPLRLAMGLHGGRLVIGRIGWGAAAQPTVIGPAVNVASRLESLAKSRNADLALSRECALAAGLELRGLDVAEVEIRGLVAPFPVVIVPKAAQLAGRTGETPGASN